MAKILLVDDDERNIFTMELVLESNGHEVVSTISGNEALSILKDDSSIELMLLDMNMPIISGYEVLEILRGDDLLPQNLPVIAVTARALTGDKEKCIEAGANSYVTKPIEMDLLEAEIGSLLYLFTVSRIA